MNSSGENILAARARHAVEELNALRQSLLAGSDQSGADARGVTLDLELRLELENAVDALHMLLWAVNSRPECQSYASESLSDFDRLVNNAIMVASRHPGAGSAG